MYVKCYICDDHDCHELCCREHHDEHEHAHHDRRAPHEHAHEQNRGDGHDRAVHAPEHRQI